jgi:hypothetical protein
MPRFTLEPAPSLRLPGNTDCNSPCFWHAGQLHLFTSAQTPSIATGPGLDHLGHPHGVRLLGAEHLRWWIEAVHLDAEGRLWALYHREDYHRRCPDRPWLTTPAIGIAWSRDHGRSFHDLGLVLRDHGIDERCEATPNTYFHGGVGDPSWAIDPETRHAYILYSAYTGPAAQQGIQVARIALADLPNPVGRVWRWSGTGWTEPGIGGTGRPVLPATASWHAHGSDAFWGPSIHRNLALGCHVVLLNRTQGPDWTQEGAWIGTIPHLADPTSWTTPERLHPHGGWYVQVIGEDPHLGTDSLAGATARLFVHGHSTTRIRFHR